VYIYLVEIIKTLFKPGLFTRIADSPFSEDTMEAVESYKAIFSAVKCITGVFEQYEKSLNFFEENLL